MFKYLKKQSMPTLKYLMAKSERLNFIMEKAIYHNLQDQLAFVKTKPLNFLTTKNEFWRFKDKYINEK